MAALDVRELAARPDKEFVAGEFDTEKAMFVEAMGVLVKATAVLAGAMPALVVAMALLVAATAMFVWFGAAGGGVRA
jgi:hypothetical protein